MKARNNIPSIEEYTIQQIYNIVNLREKIDQDIAELVIDAVTQTEINAMAFIENFAECIMIASDIIEQTALGKILKNDAFTISETWRKYPSFAYEVNALEYRWGTFPANKMLSGCTVKDIMEMLIVSHIINVYKQVMEHKKLEPEWWV